MARHKKKHRKDRLKDRTWLVVDGEWWEIVDQDDAIMCLFDGNGHNDDLAVLDHCRNRIVRGVGSSKAALGQAVGSAIAIYEDESRLDDNEPASRRGEDYERQVAEYKADPAKYLAELDAG